MDPQLLQAIRTRKSSFWIIVFAFLAIIVVGFALIWSTRDLAFETALWKNEANLHPRMVRDLLDNHHLVGMPREDVDTMLGRPTGRDSIRDRKYIYWAGTDGVIDDMWLEIEFDNETVVTTRYYPD